MYIVRKSGQVTMKGCAKVSKVLEFTYNNIGGDFVDATSNDRVERILDYAEGTLGEEDIANEKKQQRREFGREFVSSLDKLQRIMKGETSFQRRPTLKEKIYQWKMMAEDVENEED